MSLSEKPCPILKLKKVCGECPKVEQQWFIDRLLNDLADRKSRPLTPTEQCWLLLLLQGLCPIQIAERFSYNYKNLRPELSKSIYSYVEALTDKKINHWALIRHYLELAQYRKFGSSSTEKLKIQITISGYVDAESANQVLSKLAQICGSNFLQLETSQEAQVRHD